MRSVDKLIIATLVCCGIAANLIMVFTWWPLALLIPFGVLGSQRLKGVRGLFFFCSIFSLGTAILISIRNPYGGWDAQTFWNLKATSLSQGVWQSPADSIDHPLLLPGVIACIWRLLGVQSPAIPVVVALAFGVGAVSLVVGSLKQFRSTEAALLAGALLLTAPGFAIQTASQYADVPLAFFMLGTLVLIYCETDVLAGFVAGLSAGTKNEGLLFTLALICAHLIVQRSLKKTGRILLTIAPMVTLVIWFKVSLAPSNTVLSGSHMTDRILDLSRYGVIFTALASEVVDVAMWGSALIGLFLLPALGLAVDEQKKRRIAIWLITMALTFGGYLVIYVITPIELTLHLGTSLNRLLMQLMPAAIVLLFLVVKLPERRMS